MSPRVLVAKPGLDGHDRGAKVISLALRDRGCEVIYLGMRCNAEQIAAAAADEDVDVIGLSIHSGAHLALTAEVIATCRQHGLGAVPIVVGGIVPPADVDALGELGVSAVFPAGSDLNSVTDAVIELATAKAQR